MKSILNLNKNHNNNYSDPVVVDDIHNNGICCTNLTKFYGKFPAVNSLSINVNSGDIFGFLGPMEQERLQQLGCCADSYYQVMEMER